MKLIEVKDILEAEVLTCEHLINEEISSACGCDLMSDVLAFAEDNILLLTGLTNAQVLRTAEMLDIRSIVFVRGKVPGKEIIKMAEEKEIIILTTKYPMYTACGKLYSKGLGNKSG